jgi:pimeloyl-ACP methyl ester carboxylesterase
VSDINSGDRFVEVPGGRVFVRTWTPRAGSDELPVVLLHDSLGCVDLWRDFPELLADHLTRPVIAYDRLGFGRSSPRGELPSVNFIQEEAEVYFPAVRRELGVAGYVLFGHSVGGGMALRIACSSGEPCRAVVSESAQAFVEDRTLAGIRQAREQFERPEQVGKLARWHGDKAGWVLRAWTDVWLSPAFAAWSLEADLPRVRCPVLAIHGDRDEYGSVAFPRLIGSLAGGPTEVAILEGCGHVPHRERPGDVLDRVAKFLGRALVGIGQDAEQLPMNFR